MTWEEFWTNFGNFFKNIGNQLYEFWISPKDDSKTPYLATFLFALVVLVLGILLIKLITRILRKAFKLGKKKFVKDRTIKNFAINTIKVILYIILLILFLRILGMELTGISTIFSSAILAIGLSLQDVVGNFASGIIILTSKPFVAGDYVSFPGQDVEGTVKDVKFLTTILETYDRQTIVIPNKNVTNNDVVNYSTNPIRRIVISLGINSDGDFDILKKELIEIGKKDPRCLKDPEPSVFITDYSDNIFTVSFRAYVPSDLYWDVLFDLNENIFKMIKEKEIELGIKKIALLSEKEREDALLSNKVVKKKGGKK